MEPTLPKWITYPDSDWRPISPEEAGLDVAQWELYLKDIHVTGATWEGEVHGVDEWGVVLTRDGYLIHTWGNRNYKFQTASLGKAFTWAVFGLAVDDGLVKPDDFIRETWTGEGQLSHGHKYLDQGHHKSLRWRHLLGSRDVTGHFGGFPVTNGYYWRKGSSGQMKDQAHLRLPEWANWTGDPYYDNYSHAEPGSVRIYSSGGMWRLSQALTALWEQDIKTVLDERLFCKMGIAADDWDWVPGRKVFEGKDWYPHMPGYGDYIDPPYEIDGHMVRGGGGWVVMSAANLARFGHLVATQGMWKGHRLITPEWLRGHRGGNGSEVAGENTFFTAMGKVTAQGIDHPLPPELFIGPISINPSV